MIKRVIVIILLSGLLGLVLLALVRNGGHIEVEMPLAPTLTPTPTEPVLLRNPLVNPRPTPTAGQSAQTQTTIINNPPAQQPTATPQPTPTPTRTICILDLCL